MKNVDEKIKITEQIKRNADVIIGLAAVAAELGLYVNISVSTFRSMGEDSPKLNSKVNVWEAITYLNETDGVKSEE